MYRMLLGYLTPFFSAKRARVLGRAGLRWTILVALVGLVIQFALGMIINLYVMIPAAEARASWIQEIKNAPAFLTVHVLIGMLLLAAAGLLLLRAIALRDRVLITPTAAGLAALLGAFATGELFVKDGQSGESLSMAFLTGVALVCYIAVQKVASVERPLSRERSAQYLARSGN
jgi:hypothetical protein